jgi:hypothetical protein
MNLRNFRRPLCSRKLSWFFRAVSLFSSSSGSKLQNWRGKVFVPEKRDIIYEVAWQLQAKIVQGNNKLWWLVSCPCHLSICQQIIVQTVTVKSLNSRTMFAISNTKTSFTLSACLWWRLEESPSLGRAAVEEPTEEKNGGWRALATDGRTGFGRQTRGSRLRLWAVP